MASLVDSKPHLSCLTVGILIQSSPSLPPQPPLRSTAITGPYGHFNEPATQLYLHVVVGGGGGCGGVCATAGNNVPMESQTQRGCFAK